MDEKNKFYLTAEFEALKETEDLRKEAASVITLPEGDEKQPDLSYFSAILVSTGTNLNNACFLGSELVAAKDSINSKALDIEHQETNIIGCIFSNAFTDEKGNKLDLNALASTETAALDSKDMHIQIGSIVYKDRFPEIAKEIAENKWKVSMECYYKDYDIKIGDTILPKSAAELLGIEVSSKEEIFGKFGRIIKDGEELASGVVARVLRGICFSGCGIVKNPANPPSVILETSSDNASEEVVFNLDDFEGQKSHLNIKNLKTINVTSKEIEEENFVDNNNLEGDKHEASFDKIKSSTTSYIKKCFDEKQMKEKMIDSFDKLQEALGRAHSKFWKKNK